MGCGDRGRNGRARGAGGWRTGRRMEGRRGGEEGSVVSELVHEEGVAAEVSGGEAAISGVEGVVFGAEVGDRDFVGVCFGRRRGRESHFVEKCRGRGMVGLNAVVVVVVVVEGKFEVEGRNGAGRCVLVG